MRRSLIIALILLKLTGCSNAPDIMTSEIKTYKLLRQSIIKKQNTEEFVDVRSLINRRYIDKAKVPLLYVKLETGQSGALAMYPNSGSTAVWIGADGATITLRKGVLVASRGMGQDLMGSENRIKDWGKIKNKDEYSRKLIYMKDDNQIATDKFKCSIVKSSNERKITIFEIAFKTFKFKETCSNNNGSFESTYYVDREGKVRRSNQFHSFDLGHIFIERLDVAR